MVGWLRNAITSRGMGRRGMRALCLTLMLALSLAGVPAAAGRAMAEELLGGDEPTAASVASDVPDLETDEQVALGDDVSAGATAAHEEEADSQPTQQPVSTAAATGGATHAAMANTPASVTPAPDHNLSETFVITAPKITTDEAYPQVPTLWALLYDTGDLVFATSGEPDQAHGNALGVWDASSTGTTWDDRPAWAADSWDVAVRRVVVEDGVGRTDEMPTAADALAAGTIPSVPAPRSMAWWFFGMSELAECVGLDKLDTSLVSTAESAFAGCTSLAELDMGSWDGSSLGKDPTPNGAGDAADADTPAIKPTANLLSGCAALASLTISPTFGARDASLPAAMWDGPGGHVASTMLCSAAAADVAGSWARSDATGAALRPGAADRDTETPDGTATTDDAAATTDPTTDAAPTSTMATLLDAAQGVELLLSEGLPSEDLLEDGEVLGCWDVSDTGASGAPWHDRADDIVSVVVANDIAPASMAGWFAGCTNLADLEGAEHVDTSSCRSMDAAFAGCTSLNTLDLSMWNTGTCWDLGSAFAGCSSLATLDLRGWDTSSALTMTSMLTGCASLERVTLGSGFAFASGCALPEGAWEREGSAAAGGLENAQFTASELADLARGKLAGTWVRVAEEPAASADGYELVAASSMAPAGSVAASTTIDADSNVSVTVPLEVIAHVESDGTVTGGLTIANTSSEDVSLSGISFEPADDDPSTSNVNWLQGLSLSMGNAATSDADVFSRTRDLVGLSDDCLSGSPIPADGVATIAITGRADGMAATNGHLHGVGTIAWCFSLTQDATVASATDATEQPEPAELYLT